MMQEEQEEEEVDEEEGHKLWPVNGDRIVSVNGNKTNETT